jgi:hypothetical protein
MLEVHSTDKGMLIPRMTKQQREDIDTPANGLMIYQTDEESGFWYYSSTTGPWKRVSNTGGSVLNFSSGSPITISGATTHPITGGILGAGSSLSVGMGYGSYGYRQFGVPPVPTGVTAFSLAFVVPRDGFITSIAASFQTTSVVTAEGSEYGAVHVQLFRDSGYPAGTIANPSEYIFPNYLKLTFGGIDATTAIGTVLSGYRPVINFPVKAGERYVVVIYCEGGLGDYTVSGNAIASLGIE